MSKLSLRDLFAVVTIVALALGWCIDHRRLKSHNQYLKNVIEDRVPVP